MVKSLLFGLLVAGLVLSGDHWGQPEEDDVVVLTSKNFDAFLKDNRLVFVEFYAPWCGHCKNLAPIYSKLARRMKETINGVPIAKVEATENQNLAQRFEIKGFPTLKLFKGGRPIDYSGAREEEPMFEWIMKKTGPSSLPIADASHFDDLMKERINLVYFFPSTDKATKELYEAYATGVEGISCFYSHDNALKQKLNAANGEYTLALLRSFDEGHKVMSQNSAIPTDKLKAFIDSHRYPFVQNYDSSVGDRVFGQEMPAMIFFSNNLDSQLAKQFTEFGNSNPRALIFALAKTNDEENKKICEHLGINEKDVDQVRLIKFSHGSLKKYKCDPTKLADCLKDFKTNRLKIYRKSEPIPESNNGPVKVIVGDSFKKEILDSDKHVLLEIYAPWCGHCKQLAPIYEELAQKLAHQNKVVIAKFDGASNEYPGLDTQSFPTIKFYKKGRKTTPAEYKGERTVDAFIAYLEKETGLQLKNADQDL